MSALDRLVTCWLIALYNQKPRMYSALAACSRRTNHEQTDTLYQGTATADAKISARPTVTFGYPTYTHTLRLELTMTITALCCCNSRSKSSELSCRAPGCRTGCITACCNCRPLKRSSCVFSKVFGAKNTGQMVAKAGKESIMGAGVFVARVTGDIAEVTQHHD